MALNLTQFKADLKASMKAAAESNKELSPNDPAAALDKAMENIANAIAEKVDAYIKTMTITLDIGVVQVEGSATAQKNLSPIVVENGVS
ncbi:hypothetical protein [Fibrobacter succinogenes]|uniref:hypothetical protein n=1 Tax=Fibrobacter succinogenes TaxID=833 RepID=UPI00156855A7|nr:hypothetical protein [Fibrobacter succinogenes]